MKTLLIIAWRNIVRHMKRTLITLCTLSVGLGMFIAMDSLLKGMDRGGVANVIDLGESSVTFNARAADKDALQKELDNDSKVAGVTSRFSLAGWIGSSEQVSISLVAIDPSRDAGVFGLRDRSAGSWLDAPDGDSVPLLVGRSLAVRLGLAHGAQTMISSLLATGTAKTVRARVAGIFTTTDPLLDAGTVYVKQSSMTDFVNPSSLRVDLHVALKTQLDGQTGGQTFEGQRDQAESFAKSYAWRHAGVTYKTFYESAMKTLEVSRSKSKTSGIVVFVILLIAGVGIVNTILMSVYARIREIGVLRAFGMKSKDIGRMFLLEGLITGALGSLAGVVLGAGSVAALHEWGIPMDKLMPGGETMGMSVWGTIRGEWNPETMILALVLGIVVSALASRIPASRARKMRVTEALRFQ